jgi:2-dehydropantoate 2-reductase
MRFAALLAGSPCEILQVEDFKTAEWKKLLRNLAANPITAMTQRTTGILGHPDLHQLARVLLQEGAQVARAEGAHVTAKDVEQTLDPLHELSGRRRHVDVARPSRRPPA